MKKFSKILSVALLVALVLSLGIGNAFAAAGDMLEEAETTINVENLETGDSISYFQLVEWDATNRTWKLTATGDACGVGLDDLLDGITDVEAATIAGKVTGTGTAMNVEGTTATASVAPGLYYVKAVAAEGHDTIYNPAFVSADYYEGGNVVDLSTAIGSSAVLKKSSIPFDKEVTGADQFVDVKPGDTIPYKITTKVPSYGDQFVNPVFTITDTLSAGLELKGDISVKYYKVTGEGTVAVTTTASNDDVTITKNTDLDGFTVAFTKAYLTSLDGVMADIEVTYSAEVTTQALENVTYMDNKAVLTFSHTPEETSTKDDITRHYTFSIDANLNGGNHGSERTRELIKIGVDQNGQVITDFTSWEEGKSWTTYTPLAGATFKLEGAGGVELTATSDTNGYISFHGLDAGTYKLTETAAPAGYVRDLAEHTVVITPTYDTANPDVLVSYKVTVDGNEGSTYTISNMSDTDATVETTVTDGALTFPFVNTKGTELPSTGGIGTTIFYVVGGVLVLAAIILLVTKKRMSE